MGRRARTWEKRTRVQRPIDKRFAGCGALAVGVLAMALGAAGCGDNGHASSKSDQRGPTLGALTATSIGDRKDLAESPSDRTRGEVPEDASVSTGTVELSLDERRKALKKFGYYGTALRDCSGVREGHLTALYDLGITSPSVVARFYARTVEERGRADAFRGCLAGLTQSREHDKDP
jgi:hypothetical protein